MRRNINLKFIMGERKKAKLLKYKSPKRIKEIEKRTTECVKTASHNNLNIHQYRYSKDKQNIKNQNKYTGRYYEYRALLSYNWILPGINCLFSPVFFISAIERPSRRLTDLSLFPCFCFCVINLDVNGRSTE